jgi:hypothetical protein
MNRQSFVKRDRLNNLELDKSLQRIEIIFQTIDEQIETKDDDVLSTDEFVLQNSPMKPKYHQNAQDFTAKKTIISTCSYRDSFTRNGSLNKLDRKRDELDSSNHERRSCYDNCVSDNLDASNHQLRDSSRHAI